MIIIMTMMMVMAAVVMAGARAAAMITVRAAAGAVAVARASGAPLPRAAISVVMVTTIVIKMAQAAWPARMAWPTPSMYAPAHHMQLVPVGCTSSHTSVAIRAHSSLMLAPRIKPLAPVGVCHAAAY